MRYTKGKSLYPEEKELLVSIKHYFDRNKAEFGLSESAAQVTADALRISLTTVNRVMTSYHKDPDSINILPQKRGQPSYSIDASHQEAVRSNVSNLSLTN